MSLSPEFQTQFASIIEQTKQKVIENVCFSFVNQLDSHKSVIKNLFITSEGTEDVPIGGKEAQLDQIMEQVKSEVIKTVCYTFCTHIDQQCSVMRQLFGEELAKQINDLSSSYHQSGVMSIVQEELDPQPPVDFSESSLNPIITTINQPVETSKFQTESQNELHQQQSDATNHLEIVNSDISENNNFDDDESDCDCDDCQVCEPIQPIAEYVPNGSEQTSSLPQEDPLTINLTYDGSNNPESNEPMPKRQRTTEQFDEPQLVTSSTSTSDDSTCIQFRTISLNCLVEECSQTCLDISQLYQHLEMAHKIYKFRCLQPGCNRSFKHKNQLSKHKASHESIQYRCSKCNTKCKNPHYLRTHIHQVHDLGQFACVRANCTFESTNRQAMKNHIDKEHISHVCTYQGCGKSFSKISHLKAHQRIHTNSRPYKCTWPQCSTAMVLKAPLIRHIKVIHFGLPRNATTDDRDPMKYVQVLEHLL